jgi:hypothetical protein
MRLIFNNILFPEKRLLEFCSIVSYVVLMFVFMISLVLNFRLNDLKYILVGLGKKYEGLLYKMVEIRKYFQLFFSFRNS